MFKPFGPHPNTARTLLNKTTEEILALNIMFCRSGSRITLYKGSETQDLDAKPGGIGMLELELEPESDDVESLLKREGISAVEASLPEGGVYVPPKELSPHRLIRFI